MKLLKLSLLILTVFSSAITWSMIVAPCNIIKKLNRTGSPATQNPGQNLASAQNLIFAKGDVHDYRNQLPLELLKELLCYYYGENYKKLIDQSNYSKDDLNNIQLPSFDEFQQLVKSPIIDLFSTKIIFLDGESSLINLLLAKNEIKVIELFITHKAIKTNDWIKLAHRICWHMFQIDANSLKLLTLATEYRLLSELLLENAPQDQIKMIQQSVSDMRTETAEKNETRICTIL